MWQKAQKWAKESFRKIVKEGNSFQNKPVERRAVIGLRFTTCVQRVVQYHLLGDTAVEKRVVSHLNSFSTPCLSTCSYNSGSCTYLTFIKCLIHMKNYRSPHPFLLKFRFVTIYFTLSVLCVTECFKKD